jgi:hypothetical protein
MVPENGALIFVIKNLATSLLLLDLVATANIFRNYIFYQIIPWCFVLSLRPYFGDCFLYSAS